MVSVSGAVDPNVRRSDQPSIVYGFDGGDEIRKLIRSTGSLDEAMAGDVQMRGDIVSAESTRSNLTQRLPYLDLPGTDGLQQDDCGDDIPAFACSDCGSPVYVGRTCGSPRCERCWPAAVRSKVVRYTGKLDGLRRAHYARHDGRKNIDINHVVASLPDICVDSDEPLDRVLSIIKTLLEEQWGVEGFAAIYHPFRIRQEYRKDQYEHGGESGDGDMTWADVLSAADPETYIKYDPHFHLFFPAVRKSFDYSVAEAVQKQSGWVFHRITKSDDSNVSVDDLDDLVHQITYCMSHAGIREVADRSELATSMKGDLHNCYIPDGVEDEVVASVSKAAPRLLGCSFKSVESASCDAEIHDESCGCDECADHDSATTTRSSRDPRDLDHPVPSDGFRSGQSADDWNSFGGRNSASDSSQSPNGSDSSKSSTDGNSGDIGDEMEVCGGEVVPMHEAVDLLDDDDWVDQATYAAALRSAVAEWERLDEDDGKTTVHDADTPPPLE